MSLHILCAFVSTRTLSLCSKDVNLWNVYEMFLLGVRDLRETRGIEQLGSSARPVRASGGNNVPQMARDGFPDKQGTIAVTRQS